MSLAYIPTEEGLISPSITDRLAIRSVTLLLQRRAQWRLDFVSSENSMGFHAPPEVARILAESIDYSRQAQVSAQHVLLRPNTQPSTQPGEPEAQKPGAGP